MKTIPGFVAGVLFLAAMSIACAAPPCGAEFAARVRWVPDGDTLRLDSGEWVRIQGIDAPETGHGGDPAQYGADAARRALVEAVQGQTVAVVPMGRDTHGRLLAEVVLPGGGDAAEMLVERGLAFYYPHDDHPRGLRKRLLAAQISAIDSGRGFWPRILALPEALRPWVGNRRSGRAFPEGSVTIRSQVSFESLEAAFRAGYSPARAYSPGLWNANVGGEARRRTERNKPRTLRAQLYGGTRRQTWVSWPAAARGH